ncbi:MAG: methyltransferase [Candidatus Dormibacteria bacterium]
MSTRIAELTEHLAAAGFIAAPEEAAELEEAAAGSPETLRIMLARRLGGEPLAWITGTTCLSGIRLRVDAGVYVPRWTTEVVAERAAALLPEGGTAIDLCTGCGAVAAVLKARRPAARVVAGDVDLAAVACARRNGIDARAGDLFAAIAPSLRGEVDVVVAVPPYVPRGELDRLQRDTFTFETPLAYDGGEDGLDVVRRVVAGAPGWLRAGGHLVVELGGDQSSRLRGALRRARYDSITELRDADGDLRGISARLTR